MEFLLLGAKPALPVCEGLALYEDQAFLASQSGTALLDKFTHCLVVKCSAEMLDTLLTTLIRQLQLSGQGKQSTDWKPLLLIHDILVWIRINASDN